MSTSSHAPAPLRTDVVGSLLRPPELLEARRAHADGRLSDDALRMAEDRAVSDAIRLQEHIGLETVTDGEMRRSAFYAHLLESVEGLQPTQAAAPEQALRWHGPQTAEAFRGARVQAAVIEPLHRKRSLALEEFRFLHDRVTRAVPKVTLPAPSFLDRYWVESVSRGAYATREACLVDWVAILRDDVNDLVAAGCRYIQFDAPNYALLVDPENRAVYGDTARLLPLWAEADNAVIDGLATPGAGGEVLFGLHMCRGNSVGRWAAEGGYEAIQDAFGLLRHPRLLLEYDTDRAGDFTPLRTVPDPTQVVLGLVSTKTPAVESVDALVARIREAARSMPLDRLALSPQCGFASVAEGNPIPPASQTRKLEAVVEAAHAAFPDF